MSVEIILFLLRLAAGGLLLAILGLIMLVIIRDYRKTTQQINARRRIYGYLTPLQNVDDFYVEVGEKLPLMMFTSLGRSPTSNIVIEDTFASNDHALIVLRNGQWWLEDRKSKNGTLLNEMPLEQPVVITHGDTIGIGNKRFRFELIK